ncbi:hypothetical protein GNI_130510 [Gregarina niphandrodes]|uniref:Uncharacterized protein n=1 Tax=Gregarina niphandrodes TaxID=110365 RepID=A0A023B1G7_GRENI|nr:hypothetical protein GNI_130510 [Gregarina niphandrodes]EZG47692.1 hypothetical protein GNI_130510 [Gregarina niphandrodes]|eukprot:XP_011132145.1 hypothetical protein GNI_130510 [Gregarina niphandrodes]
MLVDNNGDLATYSTVYGVPMAALSAVPLTIETAPYFTPLRTGDGVQKTSCVYDPECPGWNSRWAPPQVYDFLIPMGGEPIEPAFCEVFKDLPTRGGAVLPELYPYTTPAPEVGKNAAGWQSFSWTAPAAEASDQKEASGAEAEEDWTEYTEYEYQYTDINGCTCKKTLTVENIVTLIAGGTAGGTLVVGAMKTVLNAIDPDAPAIDTSGNLDEVVTGDHNSADEDDDPSTLAQ